MLSLQTSGFHGLRVAAGYRHLTRAPRRDGDTVTHEPSPKQSAVYGLLLDAYPALLSREEVARGVADRIEAEDALAAFERDGLVHCMGGFVWLTRAAVAAEHAGS